ncbi:MAG: hypothetical protein IJT59_07800 [Desulfovibrionaceae bacterium]|nr:hypothetical protein [Desulfovibrionaceae bacterium]
MAVSLDSRKSRDPGPTLAAQPAALVFSKSFIPKILLCSLQKFFKSQRAL